MADNLGIMLAITILAEPMASLQKIRGVAFTRHGVALHGTLDLSSWDKEFVKFASMNFTDWMNIMVSTEYYFRCGAKCSRRRCVDLGRVS